MPTTKNIREQAKRALTLVTALEKTHPYRREIKTALELAEFSETKYAKSGGLFATIGTLVDPNKMYNDIFSFVGDFLNERREEHESNTYYHALQETYNQATQTPGSPIGKSPRTSYVDTPQLNPVRQIFP